MPSSQDATLTPERIGEIVDALNHGRTTRTLKAGRPRLRVVLEALGGGTVAQEVARQRTAAEVVRGVMGNLGLPPDMDPTAAKIALLDSITPDEERAVIDALPALEPHFPDAVRSARLRHDPAFAAAERAAVTRRRTGDPTRPELTRERVSELLAVIPLIHEREPSIGAHLFRPTLPDENGKSAHKIFGRRLARVIEEIAGDAHAFGRDLFWLHFISFRVGGNDSIDAHLFRASEHSGTDVWRPLPRKRRQFISEEVSGTVALLERVGREEEAAVKELADDVRDVIMAYRTIG